MNVDPVTARWAEALFRLAKRTGVLDPVRRDVERLGTELARPGAAEWLSSGSRGSAERRSKLEALVASAHPLVKNLVGLALDRRREQVLAELAEAFRRRALVERGAVEGVVESARPIGQAELDRLAKALSVDLGKEVLLEARSNPDLVGGVRVLVGARMIDRSMQGRLEALRSRMLSARLPARVN